MAAFRFVLGQYAGGKNTVLNSAYRTTGEHTTSGTASFVEDSGGDIEAAAGDVLRIICDGAVWVEFAGGTAAVGTGHFIPADQVVDIAISQPGKVSVIDDS